MSVSLELPLWGKPGDDLGDNEEITAEEIREHADELHEHLSEVADIVEKVAVLGWTASVGLYDLQLNLPEEFPSADQVEQQRLDLGIDTEAVQITEWCDEEDNG